MGEKFILASGGKTVGNHVSGKNHYANKIQDRDNNTSNKQYQSNKNTASEKQEQE